MLIIRWYCFLLFRLLWRLLPWQPLVISKNVPLKSWSSWSRQTREDSCSPENIIEIYSSILVREVIASPHIKNLRLLLLKYREYLQKFYSLDTWCLTEQTNVLRSDTTSNRINHTACLIWPTMLHISCALINSSTLKKYFNKLVGPRTFQNPSRNIIYTIGCSD